MKQVALFIIAVLLVISYGNMELHCKAESGLAGTGFSENSLYWYDRGVKKSLDGNR